LSEDLDEICSGMGLNWEQCQFLKKWYKQKQVEFQKRCVSRGGTMSKPRKRSKWQECIMSRRKGLPFDPDAIKELAKEYREGRCP